jgi:ankyrin repeat protein
MNRIDQELSLAAGEDNLPEVRRLVSVGADVIATYYCSWRPLQKSSYYGHVQVVKELREHGAAIDAKGNGGSTPLHFACYWGHLAVVNVLVSPANDHSNDTATILSKRKSRRADTVAKDSAGNTPLRIASLCGHFPVAKALLRGGADILAVNNYGRLWR